MSSSSADVEQPHQPQITFSEYNPRMGRVFFLRHGQTTSNLSGAIDCLPPGALLTDVGKAQAAEAGRQLALLYPPITDPVFFASRATRAQQTARIVADILCGGATLGQTLADNDQPEEYEIHVRDGIHEMVGGSVEMNTDRESIDAYQRIVHARLRRQQEEPVSTIGETGEDMWKRFVPTLCEAMTYAREGHDCLWVCHGTIMRIIAAYATAVDPEFAIAAKIKNCQAIVMQPPEEALSPHTGERGYWKLLAWPELTSLEEH